MSPYLYDPGIYRIAGEIMGFEKIIFGSDFPLLKPGRYFNELKSINLSANVVKKIVGENAVKLLKTPAS